MKRSYSNFNYIVWWGWSGIYNLKEWSFPNTAFPKIKAKWSVADQNQGFKKKKTFQIDSEWWPDRFPTFVYSFHYVFGTFLKGWQIRKFIKSDPWVLIWMFLSQDLYCIQYHRLRNKDGWWGLTRRFFQNKTGHGTFLGRSLLTLRVPIKMLWGPGCQIYC